MKRKKHFIRALIMCFALIGLLCVVIFFVKNSVLSAVCSTLIGSGLTFLIGRVYQEIKIGASHISGYYRDEIFSLDNPTEIIKKDKFILGLV